MDVCADEVPDVTIGPRSSCGYLCVAELVPECEVAALAVTVHVGGGSLQRVGRLFKHIFFCILRDSLFDQPFIFIHN